MWGRGDTGLGRAGQTLGSLVSCIRLTRGTGRLTHLPRLAPGTKRTASAGGRARPHPARPGAGMECASDLGPGRTQPEGREGRAGGGGMPPRPLPGPPPGPCPAPPTAPCLAYWVTSTSQAAANHSNTHSCFIFQKGGTKRKAIEGEGGGEKSQVSHLKVNESN